MNPAGGQMTRFERLYAPRSGSIRRLFAWATPRPCGNLSAMRWQTLRLPIDPFSCLLFVICSSLSQRSISP